MTTGADHATGLSRREVLGMAAAGAALVGGPIAAMAAPGGLGQSAEPVVPPFEFEEATVGQLGAALAAGRVTSEALVTAYLERVAALNPRLRAVIEVNPDALAIAAALDRERGAGSVRGPLHGIPVVIKDNIATADRMETTAGSLALVGARAPRDSGVADRLRRAGAVVLAKTNLSEWANFRGEQSSSGWSGRGGQCRNPYALDRSPCGSSSGTGVAISASLAAVGVGTETDGSIVCPSHACGLVGLKPTVGLVSRAGIVPIAHSQDTAGPMARTVADAAALLGALAGADPGDPATGSAAGHIAADYTAFLDPAGLKGARIGVARKGFWGYSPEADRVVEEAIKAMAAAGAVIVDPADIPNAEKYGEAEFEVLLYEFKTDLNAYLKNWAPGAPAGSLAEIIAFNEQHHDQELLFFGQETMIKAQGKGPLTDKAYRKALRTCVEKSRGKGLDAVFAKHSLDAIVAPTGGPPWPIDVVNGDHFLGASSTPAAVSGYPSITVPAGEVFGLPVGVTFIGKAWAEGTLIRLASGFEYATRHRRAPRFLPTANLEL